MKSDEQAAKSHPERKEVEMKQETSAGVKRAAKRVVEGILKEVRYAPGPVEESFDCIGYAVDIIDEETRPEGDWIPCSERMPTEDHGDIDGKVLWCIDEDGEIHHMVAPWGQRAWISRPNWKVSWMPFPPGPKDKS